MTGRPQAGGRPAGDPRAFGGARIAAVAVITIVIASVAAPPRAFGDGFAFALAHRVELGSGPVRQIAFAPDERSIVVATGRRVLRVALDPEGRPKLTGELTGTRGDVFGVAVSPDGETIAAIDESGSFVLWDAATGRETRRGSGVHRDEGRAVTFTADGHYLLTGDEDGTVRIWSAGGQPFAELTSDRNRSRGEVRAILPHGGGRDVVTVDDVGHLVLWDVDTQRRARPTEVDMRVLSAATGDGGRVIALGLRKLESISKRVTDTLRLIDGDTGTEIHDIAGDDQDLDAVAVTPDGRFVGVGGSAGTASVWDVETGRRVTRIPLGSAATALRFSPSGRWLATGTEDGSLSLFELTGVGPGSPAAGAADGAENGPIIIVIVKPETVIVSGGGPPAPVASGSLELRGRITSPVPLDRLTINGTEITSIEPDDGGDYLFTAFVPLPRPGLREIEIVAENRRGTTGRASFLVDRAEKVEAADPSDGRRLALVVGVSDYREGAIDLGYADDDARALRDLLVSPEMGPAAFKPEDVRLLIDEEATVSAINTGLRDFLQRATDRDFVLFFFAGHGAPDPRRPGDLYLLAHDTDPENIAGTGLLMRHVREAIATLRAREVLILTDACHSGAIGAPATGARSRGINRIHDVFLDKMRHSSGGLAILTASEAAQFSFERSERRHGVFTWYLMQALRGAADVDDDDVVTIGEAMEYVRERVKEETRGDQIPAIGPTSFDRQFPLSVSIPDGRP